MFPIVSASLGIACEGRAYLVGLRSRHSQLRDRLVADLLRQGDAGDGLDTVGGRYLCETIRSGELSRFTWCHS
jgi:hypothetical protein